MDQLTLKLPSMTIAEAERRGLEVDESVSIRDQRMVGVVGGAVAHLNRALEEAAEAGFTVTLSVLYQDLGNRPKRPAVRGRISRAAIDARV